MIINKIKPDYLAGIFALLIFIALTFYNWPLLENIDSYLYKAGSGLVNTGVPKSDDVTVVNIDRKRIGKSPEGNTPKYSNLAELTKRLTEKGVKLIVFAVPFEGGKSSSTLKELRTLSEEIKAYPQENGLPRFSEWVLRNISEIESSISSDNFLQETIKNGSNIILPVSDMGAEAIDPNAVDYLNASDIAPSFLENISVAKLSFPYPELLKDAAGYGYYVSDAKKNPDDSSFQVYVGYKGRLIPCLALRMAVSYYNLKPVQVEASASKIIIKDKALPLINGRMYVPESDKGYPVKTLDYEQVMGKDIKLPDLKNKVVVVGLDGTHSSAGRGTSDAEIIATRFIDIITSHAVSRPSYMIYLESVLFILIIYFLISFTSSKGHLFRTLSFIALIIILIGLVLICFSLMGIWLKSANIICGTVLLYLFLSVMYDPSKAVKIKSYETSRILGLNLQSQGEYDLAYEEYRTLPLDKETKDLIYNLGLEYEKKKMNGKALELYTYINKTGGFRDLDDRIPLLKESDHSSTIGLHADNEVSVLSDSSVNIRTMVGRYKIIGQLGRGSMGLVYKAQDPKINRIVAIKTIRFSDEFDEDVIKEIKERFFLEAEIAGKLSHPAIVIIHDVGDDRDLTYMAMEYLEGEDLEKFIKKENLLPIRTVLDVVAQIAEALDFAHGEGVIHRDIKPANVMLLKNGQVKVTDFGIAKAISSSKTKTGVILGTPNYMSPEQIMGQKIDSRSDIFSLGVLFYQLLTGELPFHGDNLSGLLYQITQVKHASPKSYNQKVPKICEQILDKAMTKGPAKRFRTAGEMASILRALIKKIDQLRAKKNEAE